jgi:hypothetical protein
MFYLSPIAGGLCRCACRAAFGGGYMGTIVTPNSLFMGAKSALILWRE